MMDARTIRNSIEPVTSGATVSDIARRARELVCNPHTSLLEIGAFISHDPATRLLKTINSVLYGFPRRISSVNQASLLLGLNAVKAILWNPTVFDLMKKMMVGLWEHSASTSMDVAKYTFQHILCESTASLYSGHLLRGTSSACTCEKRDSAHLRRPAIERNKWER